MVANVYFLHLAPTQEELIGPTLCPAVAPGTISRGGHQKDFMGGAQASSPNWDMVVGLGSPHGTFLCGMQEGHGKATERARALST